MKLAPPGRPRNQAHTPLLLLLPLLQGLYSDLLA
jgi:hypothetical protein